MGKKQDYKLQNEAFLKTTGLKENINELASGVLYEVLKTSGSDKMPSANSIVTCRYKGTLIDETEFDGNLEEPCPEAFRVNDLIDGWQIALTQMHVGDKWKVYIPYSLGYGSKRYGNIPAFSTLIFELELLNIM